MGVQMNKIICFALALLVAGCTTGPGKKPGTLKWKVYSDDKPLAFTPTSWTKGGLRFELAKVESTRRYTVLKTTSWGLRFHVRVQNQGAAEENVFSKMDKAGLVLRDGTVIDRLVWSAGTVKLQPGKETKGMYFNDGSLTEGASPKSFLMDGKVVARW